MKAAAITEPEFMARYGEVFEHSPWIAREAYARCGGVAGSAGQLERVFRAVVGAADETRQLALLRAHPELACAERDALTAASRAEQAGAGLDACSPEEFEAFRELNETYRTRFGFPFIIAVAGRSRAEILAAFRRRVGNDPATERREALEQVCRIGAIRIARIHREAA